MSDDLIQRLRNASAAAVFLDVPDEDSPNHPKQLFAQAAAAIARLTQERDEARASLSVVLTTNDLLKAEAAESRAALRTHATHEERMWSDLRAAEAREAKLREKLAEIAKEQSAVSAVAAADRFQQIARAALEKANG